MNQKLNSSPINNVQEQWIKWEPVVGLSKKYQLRYVVDNIDTFVLFLNTDGEKTLTKVIFEKIESYRNTDEFYRGNTLHSLTKKYGQSFWTDWTFFKVDNSLYLKWLSEESFKITSIMPVTHFSFITVDFIVDVVSAYEPTIEFTTE